MSIPRRWLHLLFVFVLIYAQWGQASGLFSQWLMPKGYTYALVTDVCTTSQSASSKTTSVSVSTATPMGSQPSPQSSSHDIHDCCLNLCAGHGIGVAIAYRVDVFFFPPLSAQLTSAEVQTHFVVEPARAHQARAPPLGVA